MKSALYEIPTWRDGLEEREYMDWITDFSVDSPVNLKLRKTDLINFAAFNEGNLFNNLFLKVFEQQMKHNLMH